MVYANRGGPSRSNMARDWRPHAFSCSRCHRYTMSPHFGHSGRGDWSDLVIGETQHNHQESSRFRTDNNLPYADLRQNRDINLWQAANDRVAARYRLHSGTSFAVDGQSRTIL